MPDSDFDKQVANYVYRDAEGRKVFDRPKFTKDDGSKEVFYRHSAGDDWINPRSDRFYVKHQICRADKDRKLKWGDSDIPDPVRWPVSTPRIYWWTKPSICEACRGLGAAGVDIADGLLYLLPDVLDAVAAGTEDIWWCEGESDAQALERSCGVVATAHHQGAGKATLRQAEWLRGHARRVILGMDMDRPGVGCVIRRFDLLRKVGVPLEQIAVVQPHRDLTNGGEVTATKGVDLKDHLEAGMNLAEVNIIRDLRPLRAIAETVSPKTYRDYTKNS